MEILWELNQTTATAESVKKVIKMNNLKYVLFLIIELKQNMNLKMYQSLIDFFKALSAKHPIPKKSVKCLKTVGNKLPTVSIYLFPSLNRKEIVSIYLGNLTKFSEAILAFNCASTKG